MSIRIPHLRIERGEVWQRIETPILAAVLLVAVTGRMILSRDWTGGALYGEVLIPLLAGALWALAAYFGRPDKLSRAAGMAVGSVLLAYVISAATSVDLFLSLVFSFPVLGLLFAYLAGIWAPGRLASLSAAVVVVGVVYAVATLTAVWVEFRWRLNFAHATSGLTQWTLSLLPRGNALAVNPNVDAMTMLVPSGVALGGVSWFRGKVRTVAALAAGIIGLGVLVTGSRGAVGGILVECVFLAIATTVARRRRGEPGWLPQIGVVMWAMGLALGTYVLPIFQDRGFVRAAVWRASLELAMQRPLTGWGSGTLSMLMASRFEDPTLYQPAMWHAHNMYLELLASVGIVGALVIAGGLGLAWRLRGRRASELSSSAIGLRLGAAAGLLGVAVQGFVESAQLYPGVLLLVGVAAAILVRTGGYHVELPGISTGARISVVGILGVSVLVGAWLMTAPAMAATAIEQGDRGDWLQASTSLEADRGLPHLDSFSPQLLAISEFMAGRKVQAEHWVEVAISEQPLEWTRWVLAAQIAGAHGGNERAASSAMRALELGARSSPSGLMTVLPMADLNSLLWQEEATRLVQEYPEVIMSEYWRALDTDTDTKIGVILDAAGEGSSCELSIALGLSESTETELSQRLEIECRAEVRRSATKNPSKREPDPVVQASGLFYAAVRRGDLAAAQGFASELAAFSTSPLARRVLGIDAMLQGDAQAAAESWSVAAVLGDLESVNLLLEQLPVDSNAAKLVALQGESIVSGQDPIAIIDGEGVPSRLRHWWSLETYAPVFLQGPLLPGAADGVEGR